MKRIFLCIVTIIFPQFAYADCHPENCGDPIVAMVALVPKAANNPFFDLSKAGCYKAPDKLGGDLTCIYDEPGDRSELEQIQLIQDQVTVDDMVVASAMPKTLKLAIELGIPVITWDSNLLDKELPTNNYKVGVSLAKLAKASHPNGGTICLQSGDITDKNNKERLNGVRDTLLGNNTGVSLDAMLTKGSGWIEISGCPQITNKDEDLAVQGMKEIFAKNQNLTLFLSTEAITQTFNNNYRQPLIPYLLKHVNTDHLARKKHEFVK